MPPTQKSADSVSLTARVRDNQRRSRARKREYVASLEERLQRCQLEGAEKNLQIQEAARKVAAENRILRRLLRERGVDEEQLANHIREDSACSNNHDATSDGFSEASSSPSESPATAASTCSSIWSEAYSADAASLASLSAEGASTSKLPITHAADLRLSYPDSGLPSASSVSLNVILQDQATVSLDGSPIFLGNLQASSSIPPPSCPCEVDSGAFPAAEDTTSSTPCTVAYQLLQAAGLHLNRDMDSLIVTLDLWSGFRAAPLYSFEGCRVDNKTLVAALKKAFYGEYQWS
ncbi:hypothetical protein BD626DRAFT_60652 [Schizophyllum amplum]|uniref:BZIP domain-containing protein n=1 Tax=Schizophyllum amplum TaxID=97359 RepID=A0A550CC43_9AGAR|nr:hypothetical protein BD626DRAFT_60652 [Auriculariopsis ampla]